MPSKNTTTLKKTKPLKRTSTGIPGLDDVLGGGLVPGHTVRITGPRGIGKTTLLLQMADGLAKKGKKVLYVSGEQDREDMLAFMRRLDIAIDNIEIVGNSGDCFEIVDRAKEIRANVVIVDSLQTAYVPDIKNNVGSLAQMEAVANYLTSFAKDERVVVIFLNHCNKDGSPRGSEKIEYFLDTLVHVDFVENDEKRCKRLISVDKNRFGWNDVTALMEMTITGLRPLAKKLSINI